MTRRDWYEYERYKEEERMVRECDLHYIWKCPMCSYRYEDYPGTNERMPCPRCNEPCEFYGESYEA